MHLARYCAPTLLGAKAANLVSLDAQKVPALQGTVEAYNRQFAACGLAFTLLCECGRRSLLLVYRPALLARRLRRDGDVLARFGYAPGATLDGHLARLRARLAQGGTFPHEIGLFLDYPADDVLAFVEKGGAGCKLCGYWKVYGDVEAARARFVCYDACRTCVLRAVEQGITLAQLLQAA